MIAARLVNAPDSQEFAHYLYCGAERIGQHWYAKSREVEFSIDGTPGTYSVRTFMRLNGEDKAPVSVASNEIILHSPEERRLIEYHLDRIEELLWDDRAQSYQEQAAFLDGRLFSAATGYRVLDRIVDASIFHLVKNKALFDYVLMFYFWKAIHDSAWWSRGSDINIPSSDFIASMSVIVSQARYAGCVSESIANYIEGGIRVMMEDWVGAEQKFRAEPYPKERYQSGYFAGGNTFHNPITSIDPSKGPAPITSLFEVTANDLQNYGRIDAAKMWLTFSADEKYFLRFAEGAVRSAVDAGLDANFLFLVIGDSPEMHAKIALLRDITPDIYVIKTRTGCELRAASASGRFFAAQELRALGPFGTFIFDIDIAFTPAMASRMVALFQQNVLGCAYKAYGRRVFPWSAVVAGGLFLSADAVGANFIKTVCLYIATHFNRAGTGNWWIDQNALFAAFTQSRARYPSSRIENIHTLVGEGIKSNGDAELMNWKRELSAKPAT